MVPSYLFAGGRRNSADFGLGLLLLTSSFGDFRRRFGHPIWFTRLPSIPRSVTHSVQTSMLNSKVVDTALPYPECTMFA